MPDPGSRFRLRIAPHADALWGLARRLTGDDAAADDLLQDALFTALVRVDQLRDDAAARPWAARILVRVWLDGRRRRPAERLATEPPSPQPGPEARASAAELGQRLAAALDALPPDQRAAVWLVDVEGLTFAEVAETLALPPGTAASRVARARAALRTRLADLRGVS